MGEEVSHAPVDVRDPHVGHAYAAGMRWSAGEAYERSMGGSADPAEFMSCPLVWRIISLLVRR